MINSRGSFFVTGGTLGHDAPCYVERRADTELHQALMAGEFCYVLTSRQMGKSSLMVRTAAKLTADSVHVVVLDLTMLGRNLTVEQWYYGLLGHTGEQLGLRKELREYWIQQPLLSPLQRWISALREIILPRCPGQLVIFIDEIDAVRSLPFSTDEFFAGIRECYNRRAQDPVFQQLAFCFLGVAAPSDLMEDERTTPFNVGRRIELSDFSEEEAKPLAFGLALGDLGVLERPMQQARALLHRVLHWTGGHPYLTQRLCLGVVSTPGVNSPEGVDEVCLNLFLSDAAREKDDNLIFVRDRMLRSEVEASSLLDVYNRVLLGKRVRDHPSEPLFAVLHLAGIVREERGVLLPRNQIYTTVFDREWAAAHAPDARLPDRRSEALRGLLRRFAIAASLVFGAIGVPSLVGLGVQQAESRETAKRRNAYVSDLLRVQASYEAGNLGGLAEPLERHLPARGQEELRGFEWGYYWRLAHRAIQSKTGLGPIRSVRFHSNGKQLLGLGSDGISGWDLAKPERRVLLPFTSTISPPTSETPVAMSLNGETLAIGVGPRRVVLMERASARIRHLPDFPAPVYALALAPDGKTLLVGAGAAVTVWDVPRGTLQHTLSGHRGRITATVYGDRGTVFATGDSESVVRLWDAHNYRPLGMRSWDDYPVEALQLSADGTLVAAALLLTAPQDRPIDRLEVWDRRTDAVVRAYPAVPGSIRSLAFPPGNHSLAAGCQDGRVGLYPLGPGKAPVQFLGHTGPVSSVTWSPDGKRLASSGADDLVRLWDPSTPPATSVIMAHSQALTSFSFSADGVYLASAAPSDPVRVWDASTLRRQTAIPAGANSQVAFMAPSRLLILDDRGGRVHDLASKTETSLPGDFLNATTTTVAADTLSLVVSDNRQVQFWRQSEQRFRPVDAGRGEVRGVALSAGGTLAAISRADGVIHLWDPRRARETGKIASPGAAVMAFSPNARQLAIAAGSSIRLRALAGGETLLEGYGGSIRCLAFSPDGRTLASGDASPVIRLWNRASGRQVGELRSSLQGVTHLAFSPRGNLLAAAGDAGHIQIWRSVLPAEVKMRDSSHVNSK